jgi:hypothetical protein
MLLHQFGLYIAMALLFFVPIIFKKNIGALQIVFAVIWLILLHMPRDTNSNFMTQIQIIMPLWFLGSLYAVSINKKKTD